MSGRTIAILAVVIGALLSSASAAVIKKGVLDVPPVSFAELRLFFAFICILPLYIYKKGYKLTQLKTLAPISLFAILNVLLFIIGVSITTANVGTVIYAAVPLITGLILFVLFKEKLSSQKTVGIVLGFLGVLLITLLPLLEKNNPFSGNLWGNLILCFAVISWSFYLVYSKRLQKRYSAFAITSNFIFVAVIVLFPLFLWDTYQHFGWWNELTFWGVFSILYMAIVVTIFAYMLNQYAIKHGGAVFAGTTFYLFPIFGFVINFFLLGEQLTPGFVIGSALALIGTYLVVKK